MLQKQIKIFAFMIFIAPLPSISFASDGASLTKIAIVDPTVAIIGSEAAKATIKEFEESTDIINLKAKYESSSADFQAMVKEAETKRLTWSTDELAEHQKKMSYVKADAELAIQKLTSEQKQLEQRILQKFTPIVKEAINEIVKEEGISILLRNEAVLVIDPKMSITAKVASRIDAKSKPISD